MYHELGIFYRYKWNTCLLQINCMSNVLFIFELHLTRESRTMVMVKIRFHQYEHELLNPNMAGYE